MKSRLPILDYAPEGGPIPAWRRSIWGLADQLLISFTNFATMILVAQGLHDAGKFGIFTLVYSAMLFANILQFALVTQPHNVLGSLATAKSIDSTPVQPASCNCCLRCRLAPSRPSSQPAHTSRTSRLRRS